MPNPMIRIHNTETNEVIDREMTDKELADFNAGRNYVWVNDDGNKL